MHRYARPSVCFHSVFEPADILRGFLHVEVKATVVKIELYELYELYYCIGLHF